MLERTLEVNRLFDFYGPLLTDKQRTVIEFYFQEDLSLGEIAERIGCSRQAVHDKLNRSYEKLREYEEKLHFEAEHKKRRETLLLIKDDLEQTEGLDSVCAMLAELLRGTR